jgi:hypothetical protein
MRKRWLTVLVGLAAASLVFFVMNLESGDWVSAATNLLLTAVLGWNALRAWREPDADEAPTLDERTSTSEQDHRAH